MNHNEKKKTHGLRIAIVGCVMLLILVTVVAVVAVLNLDRIKSSGLFQKVFQVVKEGKEAISHMTALREELLKEYPAKDIQIKTSLGQQQTGKRLIIQLINPSFSVSENEDWESKAREIAVFAKDHYKLIDDIGAIVVESLTRKGVGVTFTTRRSFLFEKSDLEDREGQDSMAVHQRAEAYRFLEQKTLSAIIYEWIPYYYRHPKPHEVVEIIEVLFSQDKEIVHLPNFEILTHFFATILQHHSEELEALKAAAQQYSGKHQKFLQDIVAETENFQATELNSPSSLEFLWAEFMATGDEDIIKRLIQVLNLPDSAEDNQLIKTVKDALTIKAPMYIEVYNMLHDTSDSSTGILKERIDEIVNTVKLSATEPAKMHQERGYNHLNLGEYDQALDEYRKALKYFPDYAYVYTNMANIYEYQGKQEESFAAMKKAYQIAPWNSSVNYGLGRHYDMQGKHDEAITLYLEALKYHPQKPLYIFGLARSYQDKGDTTNAVKYFQQYLEYAPHGEYAEFVKQYLVSVNVSVEEDPADIVTLLKKKEYQALELQLTTLLREKKKDTDGRSLLSQAYRKLYDNPDAKYAFETWLSYFEDWLEYNPSSHFANASIGMFYIRYAWDARGTGWANTVTEEGSRLYQERLSRAYEHLEKAYMLDPSDPVVPAYLIKIARGAGSEYEEMEKQFQRAIQADISEYRAYYEKLVYLMPKWYGSERQMFSFAREVVKNAPPDSLVPLVLANAHWEMYFRSKNQSAYFTQPEVWEELKPVYNLLCQRFPNSKERHNWFAVTAYLAGDYKTARKELTIIQDDWLEQAWGDFEYFTKVKNEVFNK